jgi:hypothetical protein
MRSVFDSCEKGHQACRSPLASIPVSSRPVRASRINVLASSSVIVPVLLWRFQHCWMQDLSPATCVQRSVSGNSELAEE